MYFFLAFFLLPTQDWREKKLSLRKIIKKKRLFFFSKVVLNFSNLNFLAHFFHFGFQLIAIKNNLLIKVFFIKQSIY